ncbi:hypothetical protein CERSUDRAFT_101516 [Gelatoporia subvermispora B]|uniref:Uncharacterized protein n=1 Tax=Ceriporiopsis subvermispora (strain B) TaxID=914234 RepID=M2P552_CERS8|nr:hypothetical protein CERSUDRAFT_101724 [Gelatoporia subvermispora B]EMD30339.1 hypothetical protein CERSUDRAFT_101516 [Gelatoporia subvermispora B]
METDLCVDSSRMMHSLFKRLGEFEEDATLHVLICLDPWGLSIAALNSLDS